MVKPEHIMQRLTEPIRQAPKQSLVLGVLLVVAMVTVTRAFWGRSAAAPASATTGAQAGPAPQRSSDSRPRAYDSDPKLAYVEHWLDQPQLPINRDPFVLRTSAYPVKPSTKSTPQPVIDLTRTSFWDRLEKSLENRADLDRQRRERLEKLLSLVGDLKVQSTVMGASPSAIVSGKLVRKGDHLVIAGPSAPRVVVTLIEPRCVVVQIEEVVIELPLGEEPPRIRKP